MSGEFDGLVALVTGGASGIGAAIVAELTAGGARVSVLDLNAEAGGADGSPFAVACDVSDDASCRAAVSAAEVAGAVAYLASPRSGSTTGIDLPVDGGMQGLRLRAAEQ